MSAATVTLVGAGSWGRNHLRVLSSLNVKLRVCDTDEALVERLSRDGCHATTSLDEALRGADCAFVATPAGTHAAIARTLVERGIPALIEKPLALSLSEGEALVARAEERGVLLAVGHLLLYHPAFERLKAMLSAGELGEPLYIYTQRLNLGVVRADENVLWSLGPHDISLANGLFDRPITGVSASGAAVLKPGVEDVAFINVTYEGGLLAHCHLSWLDPRKIRRLTLVCSEKMAVFDDMEAERKLTVYDKGVTLPANPELPPGTIGYRYGDIVCPRLTPAEPLLSQAKDFLACVADGRTPRNNAREALSTLRALSEASASLKHG